MPPPLEDARRGLDLLKNAIVDFVRYAQRGLTNVEIARGLNLQSAHEGKQRNYLTYSVIGILLSERRLRYRRTGRTKVYFVAD